MVIKEVVNSLSNCRMATARDIARMADIKNEDAIETLLRLKELGRVSQLNGYWWLTPEIAKDTKKSGR